MLIGRKATLSAKGGRLSKKGRKTDNLLSTEKRRVKRISKRQGKKLGTGRR